MIVDKTADEWLDFIASHDRGFRGLLATGAATVGPYIYFILQYIRSNIKQKKIQTAMPMIATASNGLSAVLTDDPGGDQVNCTAPS